MADNFSGVWDDTADASPGGDPIRNISDSSNKERPTSRWGDEDDGDFWPVSRLRRQYNDYLTAKILEIEEQKEARHYYHGAHWTAKEIEVLRKRRQPIITYNRIGRKINGIVGISEQQRQDPKAYARQPNNEEGAQVATEVVRYVCDANDWNFLKPECFRQACIEGIGGVELRLVDGDHGDPDIELAQVYGEDYFYDPRSKKMDFSDKRFDGIAKWLDVEAAIELFPDKEEDLRSLIENGNDLTTHADQEYKWIYVNEQRLRLCEHWYRVKNEWFWCFYVGFTLLDQGKSPFVDQKGHSMSRFIMFSAAVDHDGDRYGFVRNLKGAQDEINQRRSKALHISNSRRLIATKGAVDDVETARQEWARPDGYLEINPQGTVTPDNTQPDLQAQIGLLEEAKNEIEAYANMNPAALAGAGVKNLSGRAVNLLQKPGMAELGPALISFRSWCIRVYRGIFCAAASHWTGERFLRVSGDKKVAQFLTINGQKLDQFGNPIIVNAIGSLDVEVKLDEGPDTETSEADAFDVLSQMPAGSIPPEVMIRLLPVRPDVKDEILQAMQPKPDPMAEAAKQLQVKKLAADVDDKKASADQRRAAAVSDIASAAHKAHEANLNAAEFARQGAIDSQGGPGQANGGPAPAPPAPPALTPIATPGAMPIPTNAPLAAHIMPALQPPQMTPNIMQGPRRPVIPIVPRPAVSIAPRPRPI